MNELAAAVGTDAAELSGAIDAERALKRADPRVGGIGRKISIAAFAAGSNFEHHILPLCRAAA
jgi:hypothetical protein